LEHEIAIYFWSLKDTLLFNVFQIISGKIYIFLTCAIFVIYAFIILKKKVIIFILSAVLSVSASDLLCYRFLKPVIKRPRPVVELNLIQSQNIPGQNTFSGKEDYSMPSNHASNIFAFFLVYLFYIKKFWSLLFLNSILISMSRIILVKHYPSDVIFGILVGIIIGFSIVKLISLIIKEIEID
jgi:undecaprenyl-diphosphatase